MGKHSKLRHQVAPPRGMVEMVDIRTGDNHLLTPDAVTAGRQAAGRYWAAPRSCPQRWPIPERATAGRAGPPPSPPNAPALAPGSPRGGHVGMHRAYENQA